MKVNARISPRLSGMIARAQKIFNIDTSGEVVRRSLRKYAAAPEEQKETVREKILTRKERKTHLLSMRADSSIARLIEQCSTSTSQAVTEALEYTLPMQFSRHKQNSTTPPEINAVEGVDYIIIQNKEE